MKRILLARLVVMVLFGCSFAVTPYLQAEASQKQNQINHIKKIKWTYTSNKMNVTLWGIHSAHYSTFALQNPPRLVIDLKNADMTALKGPFSFKKGPLNGIDIHQFTNSSISIGRLVLNMRTQTKWRVLKKKNRLVVEFWWKKASKKMRQAHSIKRVKLGHKNRIQHLKGRKARRLLGLKGDAKGVFFKMDGIPTQYKIIELHNPSRLVVDLYKIAKKTHSKSFNCHKMPLRRLRIGRHTGRLRVVLDVCPHKKLPAYTVKMLKRGLYIKFLSHERKELAFNSKDSSYRITYTPQKVSQGEPPPPNPSGGNVGSAAGSKNDMITVLAHRRKKKVYRGHRTSMYFRKVEIHNLLRLFAEVSGLNIITSDKVKGRITLKLRNVPWDQALDLVLKTLKLGMEREGNIIRIATLKELQEEREARRKLLEAKLLSQPQKIRLITVNYAQANDMASKVKTVLSPRGQVSVDSRTNVLIVKDYVAFLIRAEGLVRSLDTQTPQVLIEARIVEANVNFEQQFGIQWGGHLLFSPMTGNSTGLAFPNPLGIRGGVPDAAAGGGSGGGGGGSGGSTSSNSTGMFGTPNYIVNFPASVGQGQGTALSFLFGTLTGVASLQLRLSAAESRGHVKVISSPKIVTLHKLGASIRQGLQIPFTSASAAGTQTQFIAATLSLNVTPQVTTDGSVFLKLNITNNAPDFSRGGAAGPAITTKSAKTNMLIKDGETMVIGGVYTRTTGWKQSRIPFFSQIPVLGLLFKNYSQSDDRAELLIFVTPRIINRAYTLGGRQGS